MTRSCPNVVSEWAFATQEGIKNVVEKSYPSEVHRWPILKSFEAKGYIWKEKYLIMVLIDKFTQFPYINLVQNLDFEIPLSEPSISNVAEWQTFLRAKFSLRAQDFVMVVPCTEGNDIKEIWDGLSESGKELWRMQVRMGVTRHYYYIKGFDTSKGFLIPPGYRYLEDEYQEFLKDNPDYSKNVFIMMKFDDKNELLREFNKELKQLLASHGLNAIHTDDKMYPKDRDLWNNVCVYMICCKYGIAILENYSKQEYNPNVALEYGFMRALDKRVLLLADTHFPKERADVSGKERLKFSLDDLRTVRPHIDTWVKEIKESVPRDEIS